MKRQGSHYDFASLERFAASGKGSAYGSNHDATTRQKKHEMLLTFYGEYESTTEKISPWKTPAADNAALPVLLNRSNSYRQRHTKTLVWFFIS